MQIYAIPTHVVTNHDVLKDLCDRYITDIQEGSVLAITSKIVSIIEGRLVSKDVISKKALIAQEADQVLMAPSQYDVCLTIKNGMLIPSAGIDESNADNVYVLHPQDSYQTAYDVWCYLRSRDSVRALGVVVTDSTTTPMRWGVRGVALGWCGFEPLYSYVGASDLHGRPLQFTKINVADSLASAAVFVMGEGSESSPMAMINNAPKIAFVDRKPTQEERDSALITLDEDLYGPLLANQAWQQPSL